jgi:hypothetical protein
LSAEHATTADRPAAASSSIRRRSARSHGTRSASVSGSPRRIFSTFAGGWKSSPSTKVQPS